MVRSFQRTRAVRLTSDGAGITRIDKLDTVAGEEPLEIWLDGRSWLVTMRSPGHDVELVHGLLLAEGVVTAREQVRQVRYGAGVERTGQLSYNRVDVVLDGVASPSRASIRPVYVSASCGMCGTASLDGIAKASAHDLRESDLMVPVEVLLALPDRLRAHQSLFETTGGVHASGLFVDGAALCVREDVGRHNAVDKAIGWALMNERVPLHDAVLQLSGRVSYELVQKASMAGIPVVAGVGAASAAAVTLAAEVGMTLVAFSRGTSLSAYNRADRITG